MTKIAVFGANGPTGRQLCRLAAGATAGARAGSGNGNTVTAVTRRPDAFPAMDGDVRVAEADVHDPDAVAAAIAGHDVVVSVLGVPFGKAPVDVYSVGLAHIVSAMSDHGVERLVCVSSSTMSPHPDQEGGWVFRKVMQPYVTNTLGRTVYDDMRRMEALVRDCDRAWTIVRPSGLFDLPERTDYRVAEDHLPGRFTARIDLADCLLRQVEDTTFVRRAIAVTTVDGQPSIASIIWREGIRKSS